MNTSVVCHSCGHRIDLADDHTRRKVRCPECGVMCDATEAARARPASPSSKRSSSPAVDRGVLDAEELAQQLWSEPEGTTPSPPPETEEPAAEELPPVAVEAPALEEAQPRRAVPPAPPRRAAQMWTEDDENSDPYALAGGMPRKCPSCYREIEADARICVGCGCDLATGKKREREYQPIQRSWEPGLPHATRWNLYLAIVFGGLVLSVGAGLLLQSIAFSLGPWLLFAFLMAFLLGTFDHTELARDRRGRCRLTRTWHICFIERPTVEIDLRHYESVVTGRSLDSGCYEWFIFFLLLPYFIVPALIWWYVVIHKTKFHAALSHSHNYPEVILYRGNSQEQAEDIAETLRDAACLRYEQV